MKQNIFTNVAHVSGKGMYNGTSLIEHLNIKTTLFGPKFFPMDGNDEMIQN